MITAGEARINSAKGKQNAVVEQMFLIECDIKKATEKGEQCINWYPPLYPHNIRQLEANGFSILENIANRQSSTNQRFAQISWDNWNKT